MSSLLQTETSSERETFAFAGEVDGIGFAKADNSG